MAGPMSREFLPSIGANRGNRLPILPALVVVVPMLLSGVAVRLVQQRWVHPLNTQVASLRKTTGSSTEELEKVTKEVDRLTRQVAALQAIARVEIVWGGASDTTSARVAFPYGRPSGATFWEHPANPQTLWYYTEEGDTIGRIAAHPRVLGSSYLWPILAQENGIRADTASSEVAKGQLIRVPPRVNEMQLRRAITEAGAPDKARNENFAQAGLRP